MAVEPAPRRVHATDRVGQAMKQHEAATCAAVVDMALPVCVRLDGHGFGKFTRGFDRPYDVRIHHAMVGAASDLLERFGASSAYTQSDEISLLWAPHAAEAPSSLPFNGRVQKLVSVLAGFASARFNAHLAREPFDAVRPDQATLRARVERCDAHFDARVFALPSATDLVEYVRWRATLDGRRNSISMLAQAHFSPAELHGVDSRGMLAMLAERKDVQWHETPSFFRCGTFVKKELCAHAAGDRARARPRASSAYWYLPTPRLPRLAGSGSTPSTRRRRSLWSHAVRASRRAPSSLCRPRRSGTCSRAHGRATALGQATDIVARLIEMCIVSLDSGRGSSTL